MEPIKSPIKKSEQSPIKSNDVSTSSSKYPKKKIFTFKQKFEKSADWKTLDLPKKTQIQDLNNVEAEYVYNKLFKLWEMEKARKFVKHLISAFFPYDSNNQLFKVDENAPEIIDAITNKKCTGIFNVSEAYSTIGMLRMSFVGEAITNNQDKIEIEKVKKLQEMQKKLPDEIRYCRIAIISDKSDKYLSRESAYALTQFVMYIMNDEEQTNSHEDEITGCLKAIIREKNHQKGIDNKRFERKSVERKSVEPKRNDVPDFKCNSFGLDGSNLDKLSALKEMMENKE